MVLFLIGVSMVMNAKALLDIIKTQDASTEVLDPMHSKVLKVMIGISVSLLGLDIWEIASTLLDLPI